MTRLRGRDGADAPLLVHDDWASYDKDENIVARRQHDRPTHTIVKGDADAAMAAADVVVKGRYVSDASQGVPIEPRAVVAQWQGDKVTIWSSTQVPYAARAGVAQTLADPRGERPHRRAAARRRLRRQVRPALRGPGRRARAGGAAAGEARLLARGGVHRRSRSAARASSMEFETGVTRDGTSSPAAAELVLDKGAYCGEGGFFAQMAAMHACGPYEIEHVFVESYLNYTNNQPSGSVRAPDRAAGLLGPRAAHGRGRARASASIRSSSAAAR